MRTVFSYAKPYRKVMIFALLLMLIELAVELIQPLFIAKIIDDGILVRDVTVVWTWGAGMMGLAFLAFTAGIVNSFFAAHAAHSFAYDVRQALFRQIQTFAMATFLRFPTSSLITRMTNDVTMIQNVLFMSLRIMLRAPLVVVGSLLMAFFVNAQLALYLVVSAPLLLFFLLLMVRKGIRSFSQVQRRLDRLNRVIQENLQAVRLIKAYMRGYYEASRFEKVADALRQDTMKAMRLMEFIMPILLFMMNVSLMAVLWFGAIEIQAEKAQVGELVAIVNYTMRMTGAFSMFSFIIIAFSRAKASATRIEEILQTSTEMSPEVLDEETHTNRSMKGAIRFENVSFQYPRHQEPVLKDISFEVAPGEKLAIMGATGSGKTTLLQLIPRFFEPTAGTIYMDGTALTDWPLLQLRTNIGFVPQQSLLFTGSIFDNLAWGDAHATREQCIEAAKKAQIHSSIERFPMKYETKVGQRGVNLSGGQKQRLAIARALVRQPAILIFDDSTSALDVQTENALWQALADEQVTMLIVTQKVQTAKSAQKILLLDEGTVVGYGTHDELLKSSPLYRQIVASQGEEDLNDTLHS